MALKPSPRARNRLMTNNARDIEEIVNMPIPTPRGKTGTQLLLEEREEGW